MKKYLVLFLLALSLSFNLNVYAANGGNDGKVKSDPMGDSGAPCRYSNLKYYDVYVPYDTTIKEIGGYATSAETAGSYKFSGSTNNWANKQNALFGFYNYTTGDLKSSLFDSSGYDSDAGGLMYVMKDGVKYYLGAIGQGCYAYSAWDWKLGSNGGITGQDALYVRGCGAASSGLFFDLILKDGTQIHFCTQSAIGVGHSIGGKNAGSTAATCQDSIKYNKADLIQKQYLEMWHCDSPWHMVEISYKQGSSTSKVRKALGISESNPVMYIRIWKGSLAEGSQKVNSGEEGGITNGSALSTTGTGSETTDNESAQVTSTTSTQFAQGCYSEEQLSNYMKMVEADIQGYYLDNAVRDTLGQSDISSLSNWEQNVNEKSLSSQFIKLLRIITILIGILFTVWMILIYLGFWFDRVNNFIDIDAVGILTLGKLHTAIEDKDATFSIKNNRAGQRVTIAHKDLLFICILGVAFGALIISGEFYVILSNLVNLVLRILS